MHWCRFTKHHALKSVWLEPHQHIVKCDIFQASSPLQSWSSRTLSLCWRSHVFQCRATILRRTSGESQRSGFQTRSRMAQLRRNPLMKRLVLSWQSLILAPRLLKALMSRRGPHEYANVGWRAPTASLAVFAAPVADTARFGSVELSDQSWIVLMLSKAVPALWLAGAKFIAICFCGPPTLQLQQEGTCSHWMSRVFTNSGVGWIQVAGHCECYRSYLKWACIMQYYIICDYVRLTDCNVWRMQRSARPSKSDNKKSTCCYAVSVLCASVAQLRKLATFLNFLLNGKHNET